MNEHEKLVDEVFIEQELTFGGYPPTWSMHLATKKELMDMDVDELRRLRALLIKGRSSTIGYYQGMPPPPPEGPPNRIVREGVSINKVEESISSEYRIKVIIILIIAFSCLAYIVSSR